MLRKVHLKGTKQCLFYKKHFAVILSQIYNVQETLFENGLTL